MVEHEHITQATSLKNLCDMARDAPLGYAPHGWSASEQAVWCMGFSEALSMVLAYIEAASPAQR